MRGLGASGRGLAGPVPTAVQRLPKLPSWHGWCVGQTPPNAEPHLVSCSPEPRLLLDAGEAEVRTLAFDGSGAHLVATTDAKLAYVWDTTSWTLTQTMCVGWG